MNVSSKLRQHAVYWGEPTGRDGFGDDVFPDPVELHVRWDDTQDDFIDDKGDEVVSKAVILTAVEVNVRGLFYLGVLADIPEDLLATPEKIPGVVRARNVKSYADKNGRILMWAVYV